ncbi:hypothetical protein ACH4TP_38030 [Streptomyces sp. NPDC021012]|uniref:hypothetical protein n=1 Tax=Streptomyces sp. NPDC021012 TaxID=3365107 RepID=UPI0037B61306
MTQPADKCCVCGSPDVTYRNYREQPFCWPCANCRCGLTPCVRETLYKPAQISARHGINHLTSDSRKEPTMACDIHTYFGLSYANYLVIPRTLLQSMPEEWQEQFTTLLTELDETFEGVPRAEAYIVQAAEEKEAGDLTVTERLSARVGKSLGGELSHTTLLGEVAELDSDDRVLVPATDPVPRYNRGRTRVQPATVVKEI